MLDPNDFLKTNDNKMLIFESGKLKYTINPYNIDSIVQKSNVVIINLRSNNNIRLIFQSSLAGGIAQAKLSDLFKSFMENNTPLVIDREIDNYYKHKLVQYFISFGDLPIPGHDDTLYITKSDNSMYIWDSTSSSYILLNDREALPQFIYEQIIPSSIWVITHTLDKFANTTVVDINNEIIYANIKYDSTSQITIQFNIPTSGKAFLQ